MDLLAAIDVPPVKVFDVIRTADRQLEQRRDISRGQKRRIKREVRARQYAHQARKGGGAQEVARRRFADLQLGKRTFS